jgi:hypothetical protein
VLLFDATGAYIVATSYSNENERLFKIWYKPFGRKFRAVNDVPGNLI